MKKIMLILIILSVTASLPCLTSPLAAAETWTARTGLNGTPGLVFNRTWDPGFNGTAMTFTLQHQSDALIFEAGVEAGYSYTGLNLLFPIQAGLIIIEGKTLQFSVTAALMPGLIISRPAPYFLMAAELAARLTWAVNPGFNLSLSAGPRYTTSPDYSAAVAPLELIDLTIGLAAGFVLGK
ncbi:MAG: hypothetical protein JEZ04_04230 [Spirochaetales bacterium]|nr:hypothetical protein [Spirochaetales bacterium]